MSFDVFGFLKQFLIWHIAIDPCPLNYQGKAKWQKLKIDFAMDHPDASEEIDSKQPDAYSEPLQSLIQVDADHAYDVVTCWSLTGSLDLPQSFGSVRDRVLLSLALMQPSFMQYILCAFGIHLDGPTQIFGDNFSVITIAKDPNAELKKKHVALSFHIVHKTINAGVIEPFWPNVMTKELPP